jgi:signal transduction histidine kinase
MIEKPNSKPRKEVYKLTPKSIVKSLSQMVENDIPLYQVLFHHRGWYIKLRWVALALMLLFIVGIAFILPVFNFNVTEDDVSIPGLLIVVGYLSILNGIYYYINSRLYSIRDEGDMDQFSFGTCIFVNIQVLGDILSLAFFIYFSGGMSNPFMFFFVFHIMLASILLHKRSWSFIHTGVVLIIMGLLSLLEYLGVIHSYTLFKQNLAEQADRGLFLLLGQGFGFTITLLIVNYIGITIRSNLERMEQRLYQASRDIFELEQSKSQFMRTITHELKSPVTGILTILQSLRAAQPNLKKEIAIPLNRAEARSKNLLQLTQELLEFSRLDSLQKTDPAEQTDPLPLYNLIKQNLDPFHEQAASKKITLIEQLNPQTASVRIEESDFDKIFENLVSNAIRYTPDDGSVWVRLDVKDEQVCLEVQDSGIGMKPEQLEKIFTSFYRTPEAKKFAQDGTGLGLAITKKLVERWSGRIEVTSKPENGTLFRVCFPIARSNL